MIRLQLQFALFVMSPIVLLADLAVFSVGRGLEPPIPVLNLLHRLDLLCNDYADMFETPSGVPNCKIKHWIDLIDKNAQPPKPRQYCMSSAELAGGPQTTQ